MGEKILLALTDVSDNGSIIALSVGQRVLDCEAMGSDWILVRRLKVVL